MKIKPYKTVVYCDELPEMDLLVYHIRKHPQRKPGMWCCVRPRKWRETLGGFTMIKYTDLRIRE